jgi:UDP-glucose 4-epimerase
VHRCLQTNGLGYQVFNAVNDTITANGPTADFLRQWCPRTPHRRPLVGEEAPISNRKIREVLGFREEHPWRQEVAGLKAG